MSRVTTPPAHTGKPLPPTQQDRIAVYAVADGAALLCYPVDAKELVASGAYTRTPPSPEPAAAPAPAVEDIGPVDAPSAAGLGRTGRKK